MQFEKVILKLVLVAIVFSGCALGQSASILQVSTGAFGHHRLLAQPQAASAFPISLIDYPGASGQQLAWSINDTGKIVGYYNTSNGGANGYLLQGKMFKDILFPGAQVTLPFGINKMSLVVGTYAATPDAAPHGFTLKGKTFTSFDYPNALYTEGTGVNATGDIIGVYQTPDFVAHGFLLHKGVYTSFDAPGAGFLTYPYAINQQGVIVGFYQDSNDNDHGFIVQNGSVTQIDYPGSISSQFTGINDSGDMVGDYTTDNVTWHGFLLSGGVYTSFDVPFPGITQTFPSGINNKHQIVGSYGAEGNGTFYDFGFATTY